MKAKEIHAMSDKDLDKQLKDGRAELFNLRFQMATSQLDNTARVCAVKKDIARVQTEMRMRELAADKKEAKPKAAKPVAKPAPAAKAATEPKAAAATEPKAAATDTKNADSDAKKVEGA